MTVGILVQRFGAHIRNSYSSYELDADVHTQADKADQEFPADLRSMRDSVAHHLILLVLLARSDNDFDHRERDVIVEHCIAVARRRGIALTDDHNGQFAEYVSAFRPSLIQLDPALSALIHAPHQEVGELMRAAQNVIAADGVTRSEELHFIAELNADLEAILSPP
jgi:hypothetical protein